MRLLRHSAMVAGLLAWTSSAAAQHVLASGTPFASLPAPAVAARALVVEAGSGQIVNLAGPAENLYTADPKIAAVRPGGARTVFVFGVSPGRTSVAALDTNGRTVGQYEVTVTTSTFSAQKAAIGLKMLSTAPDVSTHATPSGVAVEGTVQTPADAARALRTVHDAIAKDDKVVSDLTVAEPVQVLLRVRVAEMSRSLTRDLGLNWNQLGGDLGSWAQVGLEGAASLADVGAAGTASASLVAALKKTNVEAMVDALAEDQLIKTLAEPNLTALSGETASFLVGGEYPIPVSGSFGQVSVDYKQYGISLTFVPTVLSGGKINLRVRPEVSALTSQGAVTVSTGTTSLQIPAITVRRVETTVELGSGQSFAIAGLLEDQVTQIDQGTPFLGDVPILGALFRSDSFKRQQSELVIIVTPYIVRPVSAPHLLQAPGDFFQPANDLERLLLLRQTHRASSPTPQRISGDAGFIVE